MLYEIFKYMKCFFSLVHAFYNHLQMFIKLHKNTRMSFFQNILYFTKSSKIYLTKALIITTIFTFFYINRKKNIVFIKSFDFWFLMDLHVIGCPGHDLSIAGKCLSVYYIQTDICMQNFMKFYI